MQGSNEARPPRFGVNEERLESDVPGNSYASFGGGRLEKCLDIADILGSRGNSLAAYPTSEPTP